MFFNKKHLFAFLVSAFLISGSGAAIAQQTTAVEIKSTVETAVNANLKVSATSEIITNKQIDSTMENKIAGNIPAPAAGEKTAEIAVNTAATPVNVSPAVPKDAVQPVDAGKSDEVTTASAAVNGLSAKDFTLKQEELAYGVSLVQKGIKKIPFKDNPAIYDASEKEELLAIAKRLFPDDNLKTLGANLNSIAITLLTSKKDDKDMDYGVVALELTEAAKKDFDVIKTNIKNAMLLYFKGENFFIHEKFPVIVILAPNLPDNKKEDLQWASELIQKKLSSK